MEIFLGATTLIFALIAIYFSYKYERKLKEAREKEEEITRKVFELSILDELADKIGYSLNIETIAQTISLTSQNLFELTSASYALVEDKTIKIKTYLKENVRLSYSQQVTQIIASSLKEIDSSLSSSQIIEEPTQQLSKSNTTIPSDAVVESYFNIPLVVNNQLLGLINISSRKKDAYKDADMSLLYKIVNNAQQTLTRLRSVIETERGKLDSLILSLPSGTILFGVGGNGLTLSVINRSAKQFLSLPDKPQVSDVIASLPHEMKIIESIKGVIEEKKSIIIPSVKINGRDFRIYLTPVFMHDSQEIIGVSLIMRDMSLEQKIEQVRIDFTNMVVHELRAPATAIKGASSLLKDGTLAESERQKMIDVIFTASDNLLSTISEVLDVGKLEEGKLLIRKTKGDFVEFARKHVDIFLYAARQKGIDMEYETEKNIPEFMFDHERIGQVLNNLVSNALKFTPNNGKIEVKIWRENENLEVMIADTGIGIAEEQKPFLFTKFGRIRQGLTGPGESSGLGLFISKKIIESHGGKIWIESQKNSGTKIFFTLPIKPQDITEERVSGALVN